MKRLFGIADAENCVLEGEGYFPTKAQAKYMRDALRKAGRDVHVTYGPDHKHWYRRFAVQGYGQL